MHARNKFIDQRKEDRDETEAERELEYMRDRFPDAPPFAQGRYGCTEDERYREQECDAQHHAEREKSRADQVPPARALLARGRAPDAVHCVLQLAEHRGGTDEEGYHSDDRRHQSLLGLVGRGQHALDRFRAVGADHAGKLTEDLAARRLFAKNESGDGDGDEEQRRDGKQRVVRERGAHARRVIRAPRVGRLLHQADGCFRRDAHRSY